MAKPTVFCNARIATMTGSPKGSDYNLIDAGALAINGDGQIAWVGNSSELPSEFTTWPTSDLDGRLITPGLVDCHTHVVFGGNRAREFELRLEGASYEEIARAGGGIGSTVRATRETTEQELLSSALTRIDAMIAEGVTTIEVKSGYGLDIETELRMLRVAKAIARERPVRIRTTFLGAHAVPPEFADRSDAYLDEICIPALRAGHREGLIDAVDGFCEGIAFSRSQIEKVFKVANTLGLPVKLHAEQLSNSNGAVLAAKSKALSADHLEHLDAIGVRAMADANTVAVLLPGAFYTLRETQRPPVSALHEQGVPIAIATDCNPGSSPLASMLLAMNMACTLFRLTPAQALAGVTKHAAMALGISDIGQIVAGARADLAVWDVEHPAELSYRVGFNSLHQRVFGGA